MNPGSAGILPALLNRMSHPLEFIIPWTKKGLAFQQALKNPGNVLLSHKVTLAVPSALEDLTAVFGMGTGVAPPLSPPRKIAGCSNFHIASKYLNILYSKKTTA